MKAILLVMMAAGGALCQEVKTVTTFSRSSIESTVKGSPYSADSVTETVQVLSDGNRITHTNKSSFARDSEGRTRRETTIQGLGPLGYTAAPLVNIVIEDPVAKISYFLDPKMKTAFKTKTETAVAGRQLQDKLKAEQIFVERRIPSGAIAVAGTMEIRQHFETRSDRDEKQEDLGTRNVEGMPARGTRTTMTIKAGEMGNERPIEVVTETWYSAELKANVLMRHTDPRSGETTTKLLNVKIAEPSRSLFEPSADYKIEEGTGGMSTLGIRVHEDR